MLQGLYPSDPVFRPTRTHWEVAQGRQIGMHRRVGWHCTTSGDKAPWNLMVFRNFINVMWCAQSHWNPWNPTEVPWLFEKLRWPHGLLRSYWESEPSPSPTKPWDPSSTSYTSASFYQWTWGLLSPSTCVLRFTRRWSNVSLSWARSIRLWHMLGDPVVELSAIRYPGRGLGRIHVNRGEESWLPSRLHSAASKHGVILSQLANVCSNAHKRGIKHHQFCRLLAQFSWFKFPWLSQLGGYKSGGCHQLCQESFGGLEWDLIGPSVWFLPLYQSHRDTFVHRSCGASSALGFTRVLCQGQNGVPLIDINQAWLSSAGIVNSRCSKLNWRSLHEDKTLAWLEKWWAFRKQNHHQPASCQMFRWSWGIAGIVAQVVKVFMDQNRLQETTSILLDALKVLVMRFGSATNLVLPLLAYDDRRIGTLLTLLFFFYDLR